MSNQIFRKVSLERLSSPEQLDQLMQVTTPRAWTALIGVGLLIACAVLWGVYGSIPTKVVGQGIMMKSGGVFDIVSTSEGSVKDLYIKAGDIIQKGQVVARIAQSELLQQIKSTGAVLEEQEEKYHRESIYGAKEVLMEQESMRQQRANLASIVTSKGERVNWLQEKLQNQKEVLEMGLITRQRYLDTVQELSGAKLKIREADNEIQQIDIRLHQLEVRKDQERSKIQLEINETKRRLNALREDLNEYSRVVSPHSGRVLEVDVNKGAVIGKGASLAKMELMGRDIKNLETVLYFPAREGKKIRRAMRANVAPSTVKQEEFGFLLGLVTYVSDFPSTAQAMMRTLQNDALVRELSTGGTPIEVRVDLIPDPRTPSGYKWSSSRGPEIIIQTGTLCQATITVDDRRPISMIIPLFRKHIMGVGDKL